MLTALPYTSHHDMLLLIKAVTRHTYACHLTLHRFPLPRQPAPCVAAYI